MKKNVMFRMITLAILINVGLLIYGVKFGEGKAQQSQSQTLEQQAQFNKKIMKEFDKTWAELKKKLAEKLKGLSQDKIRAKLTPLVVTRVTKKLGVTKSEVRLAIKAHMAEESEEQKKKSE